MRIAIAVFGVPVLGVEVGATPPPETPPRPPVDLDAVHIVVDGHGGPDTALCGADVGHLPWTPRHRGLCAPCEAAWVLIRREGRP